MSSPPRPNYRLSKTGLRQMQTERLELFQSQDLENGFFDVTFDIEGKKLHAHRFTIAAVSETMKAMLSDRWSNIDEDIKIETYTYDNFYQFLRFVYSGECSLSNENVFQLLDMSEFYGIPLLKELCDWFLSSPTMIKIENVEEMYELSQRYSLTKLYSELKDFVISGFDAILESETFTARKKPSLKFLSSVVHLTRSNAKFFKAVYKWSEQQVLQQQPADVDAAGDVNLQKAIKAEVLSVIPRPKYSRMGFDFLMKFVVEKGFSLTPAEIKNVYDKNGHYSDEYLFELVYDVAKKQVQKKQKMTPVANFNLINSIKADLAEVIRTVEFGHMEDFFLEDFVVAKGIITKEQAKHVYDTRVRVTVNGKSVSGVFKDKLNLLRAYWMHKHYFNVRRRNTKKVRFTQEKFYIPSNQNKIKKMKGVTWYLCLEDKSILTFKHHTDVHQSDFLLAEMKGDPDFELVPGEMTHLTANYNNIESV